MIATFQVVFGLVVFAITRQIYLHDASNDNDFPITLQPLASDWSDRVLQINPALLNAATQNRPTLQDPAEISRQANEYFANQQYSMAASLYGQLLLIDPSNVDTHNNLGITLHYLGRSAEALDRLNEGARLDPGYQRIWLTLGFVNQQRGNIEEARAALTTAAEMGTDTAVGKSAQRMLGELP